jgi:hypothetical protein
VAQSTVLKLALLCGLDALEREYGCGLIGAIAANTSRIRKSTSGKAAGVPWPPTLDRRSRPSPQPRLTNVVH